MVLNIGPMNHDTHHQPENIDQDMSLPSIDLLASVIPSGTPCLRCSYRLAADERRAGRGCTPSADADMFTEHRMDTLPETPQSPNLVGVTHGRPRRKVVRHEAQSVPTSGHIKNTLQNLPK